MVQVRIVGWKPGLDTVRLIKLIREQAQLPLNESLALVNQVLNDETVAVEMASEVQAEQLVTKARELGAIAEMVRDVAHSLE